MDKKIGIIGWIILAIMVGIALFAPIIATYDPHSTAFSTFLRPSNEHFWEQMILDRIFLAN